MSSSRSFGIVTSLTGLQGGICVNSLDFSQSADVAEARDEKGRVVELAAYSKKTTVSITGIMDSAKGDLATAGSKITLSGHDYLIDSVSRKESNSGFVEVTISAQTADSATVTIISDDNE